MLAGRGSLAAVGNVEQSQRCHALTTPRGASVWTRPQPRGPKGQGLKEGRGDATLSRWGQRVEKRKSHFVFGLRPAGTGGQIRPPPSGLKIPNPYYPDQQSWRTMMGTSACPRSLLPLWVLSPPVDALQHHCPGREWPPYSHLLCYLQPVHEPADATTLLLGYSPWSAGHPSTGSSLSLKVRRLGV